MDSIDEGVWAEAGSHQNIREVRGGKQSLEIRGCQSEESVQGTAARARTHKQRTFILENKEVKHNIIT